MLQLYRGREINTAGDGFLAAFDGPARAIRCAGAIREAVRSLGLEVRCGIHTGECELWATTLPVSRCTSAPALPRSQRRARCWSRKPSGI